MKVGTDSVLLGAACESQNAVKILDIGTGCGILALMLAQKSNAEIIAMDIDSESCKQASENFDLSPWKNRLHCIETDFRVFSEKTDILFDCIISNPPYFDSGERKTETQKSRARHIDFLDFDSLCKGTEKLLLPGGVFYVIIPAQRLQDFIDAAEKSLLYIQKMLLIHPVNGFPVNRYVCVLRAKPTLTVEFDRITIRQSNTFYTKEYVDYVKDYYLHLSFNQKPEK